MNASKFNLKQSHTLTALGAVVLLTLLAPGCATKKWVQAKVVQPLETKISGVDKKTDENATKITDVDQKAESGISDAQAKAETADRNASKADEHAGEAQSLAQKGVDQAVKVGNDLENIDNYQPREVGDRPVPDQPR